MACVAAKMKTAVDGGMSLGRRTVFVHVLLSLVCLSLMVEATATEATRSCYECEMNNIMQSDAPQPRSDAQPRSGAQVSPVSRMQVKPCTCGCGQMRK